MPGFRGRLSYQEEIEQAKQAARERCRRGEIPVCTMRPDCFGMFEVLGKPGLYEECHPKDQEFEAYWKVKGLVHLKRIPLERIADVVEREKPEKFPPVGMFEDV